MKKPTDLTVPDIAAELSLHPDTVRRLLATGVLPGYRAGLRQWRMTRAALDAFKAGSGLKRQGRPRKEAQQ